MYSVTFDCFSLSLSLSHTHTHARTRACIYVHTWIHIRTRLYINLLKYYDRVKFASTVLV